MTSGKNVVESFRDVVQDLLVPELKSVKTSIESLNHEMNSLRTEMKLRDEKMEQLIRSGDAHLEQLILAGDARLEQLLRSGDALWRRAPGTASAGGRRSFGATHSAWR